ncbi:glycosyltransferase family protein [Emticicia sp. SJ17W-69]|uniref:glycosyltransferase family protein n=1 Tax=Emticicia sp. SJ17W-69 TaxID=3421657 RepID=UPI003EB71482
MKFLFIIQGEGRGHLTQAIALSEMLQSKQHQVVGALVGSADGKTAPPFFVDNFANKIISFKSPCLVYCKKTKALDIRKTLSNSILGINKYFKSLQKIQDTIQHLQPDVIINFYDVLGGIHQFVFRPKVPMVCVAHQYLLLHQDFEHPKNHWLDKLLVNTNTRITALGAAKKIALSFTPFSNDKKRGVFVAPPLLRSEIHQLETTNDDYILAYVTQASLADELINWHSKNSRVKVHCFWDKPQNTEVYKYSRNLHFHRINAQKFLEMMQNCKGLATSAGFESVCEAMYLGKPTLMIPVPKHYEQACNALDAKRAGAGITGTKFDLSSFINYLPHYQDISQDFQTWHSRSSFIFLREIEVLFERKENISADAFGTFAVN